MAARLRAAEENLDAKAKLEQQRIRMSFEQRAYDRLREIHEEEAKNRGAEALGARQSPYQRMLPILVHLSDLYPTRFGRTLDPAEPLVRALQQQTHPRTAKILPRRLYPRLENGGVLVLLDGFDSLTPARQAEVGGWLAAFRDQYDGNGLVVTGDVRGSGLLTGAGMTPIYLRPWDDQDTVQAAQKWAVAWPDIAHTGRGRPTAKPLDPAPLLEALDGGGRGLTPAQIIAKLWAGARGVAGRPTSVWGAEVLKAFGLTDDLLSLATRAAVLEHDEGVITPSRLTELAMNLPVGSAPLTEPDPVEAAAPPRDSDPNDDLDSLFGDARPSTPPAPAKTPAPPAASGLSTEDARAAQKLNRQHAQQLLGLFKRGLLIEAGEGYLFRHSLTRHLLVAWAWRDAPDAALVARSQEPRSNEVLMYLAGLRSVEAAVEARLRQVPDVRYSHLTDTARWLAFQEGKPAWRERVLRLLGAGFGASAQFPALRERLASALIGSRDPDARKVFDKSLNAPDAVTRRVSALAAGALRDGDVLSQLNKALRSDVDEDVKLAAVAACLAIGPDGYEQVGIALTTGKEFLRQMAAESLALLPDVGYETLYEAIREEDVDVRRAAVFGLGRLRTEWSAIEVYRVFLDDTQWYVRSAAQTVISDLQDSPQIGLLRRPPAIENVDWLRDWVSGFGARMSEINPEDALMEMLHASDPSMQPVAAQATAQLGLTHRVASLYAVLQDLEPVVRDSAQRALIDIELMTGQALPAPA
ncbi:MAG: HEAT repeat domain-containing protein [Anaerolineae bacterium]|nr:HEAT repeat domain-containing protein [Anaerolineae bacterium]